MKWTTEENNYLKDNYNKLTVSEISSILNRDRNVIWARLSLLNLKGLSNKTKFTDDSISFILSNYNKISTKDLSNKTGIPEKKIYGILHNRGLKKTNKKKINTNIKLLDKVICTSCLNSFEKSKDNFYFKKNGEIIQCLCKTCAKNKVKRNTSTLDQYIKSLLRNIQSDRKYKKGDKTNIDIDYILNIHNLQNGKCIITGITLTTDRTNGRNPNNLSIDRIDNSRGYIKGNIQLICDWANMAKSYLSMEKFKEFINTSYNHLSNG